MITHLHKASNFDGSRVCVEQIQVGFDCYFRNNSGGVLRYRCTSLNDSIARFESLNKDWPGSFNVELNAHDLTDAEFVVLVVAMKDFTPLYLTPEEIKVLSRAESLGYISRQSYTQTSWLNLGIARMQAA